ncbi:hypothetical protein B0H16DRAFT_1470183 [Mycena metata]|uniref:Uncharacterized protein n=1 Tax=Mycena metata TaxID=1033252 RepID=A0AAD7HVE8_9AGAR|nr:hypothetical protein B0H16DRAFT_1470183 [Mycena metata]
MYASHPQSFIPYCGRLRYKHLPCILSAFSDSNTLEVAEVAVENPLRREGGTTVVTAVGAVNRTVLEVIPKKEVDPRKLAQRRFVLRKGNLPPIRNRSQRSVKLIFGLLDYVTIARKPGMLNATVRIGITYSRDKGESLPASRVIMLSSNGEIALTFTLKELPPPWKPCSDISGCPFHGAFPRDHEPTFGCLSGDEAVMDTKHIFVRLNARTCACTASLISTI